MIESTDVGRIRVEHEPKDSVCLIRLFGDARKGWQLIKRILIVLTAAVLFFAACSSRDGTPALQENAVPSAVPVEDIHFDTFNGSSVPLSEASEELIERLRDAIPPLNNPEYVNASGGDWLSDEDLVLGYVASYDQAYAYPIKILNYHEIVNDELGSIPVLISYCPLCRSGVVYDRRLNDDVLTFGNTSALYESDLVMFDRQTDSYWQQISGMAIFGALSGSVLGPLPSTMMTWNDWKTLYPATQVLSLDTGYQRAYSSDAFTGGLYEGRLNQGQFSFPVGEAAKDNRIEAADLVVSVEVEEHVKAYPVGRLGNVAVNDQIGTNPIVVFSRSDGPTGNVFSPLIEGEKLSFKYRAAENAYFDSQTDTMWDFSGRALIGELAGKQLEQLPGRISFWFSFAGAYPEADVYLPSKNEK